MFYNPLDWYWRSEDGRVYSSAREAIVGLDDPTWRRREEAGSWTPWPVDESGEQSDDALAEVLAPHGRAVTLDGLRKLLCERVDSDAEALRLRHITPGSGQAMTYFRKVEEAHAILRDAEPEAEDYPLLAASVGIDGDDLAAVAALTLQMDASWAQFGASIERARLTAKRQIEQAENVGAARDVTPDWPQ